MVRPAKEPPLRHISTGYGRTSVTRIIDPYGGGLINLFVPEDGCEQLLVEAKGLPYLQLSDRSVHDLELLAVGAFSPLSRFMGSEDYASVLNDMRLANGMLWPMPITLTAPGVARAWVGRQIALRNARNDLLAVLTVDEVFDWDRLREARLVTGTVDPRHPLVAEMSSWGPLCITGPLRVLHIPRRYDFAALRLTPLELRSRLADMGSSTVIAFQTRNPLHRSHEEMTKRAAAQCSGTLLIHPVIGLTKPGDIDYYTRVRSYRVLVERYYDPSSTVLSLLPLAMRMAGPREALWHAIIRRNYGATHFIIGRDHAGPGADSTGRPFYGPYDAQELLKAYADEIGVTPISFGEIVYLPAEDRYEESHRIPPGAQTLSISGTQVRNEYLAKGRPLPRWFTRRETATFLSRAWPPQHKRGFCVWLTGLSGAGKSSTAEALTALLLECGRQVTLLDGDIVRTHLSKGLGFSREDRDTNIRRIGFVAAEIVRHGGAVIAAAVSPYRATRNDCRNMIGPDYVLEIFVDTPFEICRQRDTKGLYERALRHELTGVTGVDDPYEAPVAPDMVLTTTDHTIEENARRIVGLLAERGFVRTDEVLEAEENPPLK